MQLVCEPGISALQPWAGDVAGTGASGMLGPMDGGSGVPTDDELTALALAADAHAPLDPDAVPIDSYLGFLAATEPEWSTLPDWYMAPVTARRSGRARRVVILAVVGAFLLIEAFGLCSTYGQLPFH